MDWTRDRGHYETADGLFATYHTASTASCGWPVFHDPAGRLPGWGRQVGDFSRLRDAKRFVADLYDLARTDA